MKQIRRNVYETNSSSSHSITIADKDGMYDTMPLNKDGNVVLEGGEYGWGYESYNDALSKANYCAVDSFGDKKRMELLKEVIKTQTGCNEVIFDFSTDWNNPNWSYVDHQSSGTSSEAFENESSLREFIFNPNSVLVIDNDNH